MWLLRSRGAGPVPVESRPWDWLLAGALVASAARRGAAGLRTLRYRANLSRQRRYEVTSTEIP